MNMLILIHLFVTLHITYLHNSYSLVISFIYIKL